MVMMGNGGLLVLVWMGICRCVFCVELSVSVYWSLWLVCLILLIEGVGSGKCLYVERLMFIVFVFVEVFVFVRFMWMSVLFCGLDCGEICME